MKITFGLALFLCATLVHANAKSACTNFLEKIDSLEDSLSRMNETLNELKEKNHKLETSRCAFAARTNKGQSDIKVGDSPIVFNHATLNTCGGYDKTTGIFTVPHTGKYWFSMRVQSRNTDRGHIELTSSRGSICQGYITAEKNAPWGDMSTCSSAAKLYAGDKVMVKGISDTNKAVITGSTRNGFSGFLIYPE